MTKNSYYRPLTLVVLLVILVAIGVLLQTRGNKGQTQKVQSNKVQSQVEHSNKQLGVKLYLSPSSQATPVGSTLTLAVYEDSLSNPVNAVQVILGYDARVLHFQSIDSSSSALTVVAASTGGNGSVNIARGHVGALTGQQLVAKVKFLVMAKSQKTSVNFASGSAVVSSTSSANILDKTIGGQYSSE